MKVINKNQTKTHNNSPTCKVFEYGLGQNNIDGAVAIITGRYPENGRVVNKKCTEIAFVIEGKGRVAIEDKALQVESGDLIMINKNERYYWEGNLKLFIYCTPAWFPEQHKEVS